MTVLRVTALVATIVFAAVPRASAQQPTPGSSENTVRVSDFNAWLSGGIGGGRIGAAGIYRESISLGPLLLMARQSDIGPVSNAGSGVQDRAALVGLRTTGHRAFASAAVGYASATSYSQSEQCGCRNTGTPNAALAYDLGLHVNNVIPGLAVSVSGTAGNYTVRSSMVTVSIELGWFGH